MGKEIDFKRFVEGKGGDPTPPKAPKGPRKKPELKGSGPLMVNGPMLDEAAVRKAEAEGAALIARHWLAALGDLGAECASADFLERMTKAVGEVMAKGWGPFGPRQYEVKRHNTARRRIPLDKQNTLLMRYKAGVHMYSRIDGNGAKFVVEPFEPNEWMRKPRHATHYRFFFTVGAVCNFAYQPDQGCYVPTRPDLLELTNSVYSPILTAGAPILHDIELAADLPGMPELDDHSYLVKGFGVEFLHWGVRKLHHRVEMRVMMTF